MMTAVKAEGERDRILKEVRATFEREPRINLHKYPVHMEFSDGVLTLEGETEHIAALQEMAEFDAWYVFGVEQCRESPRGSTVRSSV